MSTFPDLLIFVLVGWAVGSGLCLVSVVKTVRYHGWGKKTWAPPAVPWFVASMIVGVVTLVGGLVLMNPS
jgi:hypothetical protein